MDPRFRRTRERLRAALYELAAVRPVADVSVAELCRIAGITRDTFYRHAKSPVDLLADFLGEEVAPITETRPEETASDRDIWTSMVAAETALLEHVVARAAIYRNAMNPHLIAPLRDRLEALIRDSLINRANRRPEILPGAVAAAGQRGIEVAAASAAAGNIGAIEVWLRGRDLDISRDLGLILAAAPAFWWGTPPDDDPRDSRVSGSPIA
ncbi:hypothetical protein HFP15_03450 [Amycolatopsis sp. K13G38]|uniref:HTH tetR-type domain-containing protein n=1 Tax=Amycolatopsis acididurans TaxID=2724524 RepID=A0ABX1IWU3_9PSEU|nr:hypothetical protein [Amycolatopsis acididurans]NKQ51934.1 hypothetical protein [Amycolatopsis acididurans]